MHENQGFGVVVERGPVFRLKEEICLENLKTLRIAPGLWLCRICEEDREWLHQRRAIASTKEGA